MAWKWDTTLMDVETHACSPSIFKLERDRLVATVSCRLEQGIYVSDFGSDHVPALHVLRSDDGGLSWSDGYEGPLPGGQTVRGDRLIGERGAAMPDGTLVLVERGCERSVAENRAVLASVGRNPEAVGGTCDYWPADRREELVRKGYQVYGAFTGTVMTETALEFRISSDGGSSWERRRIEGVPPMARRVMTGVPLCLSDGTILAHGWGNWKPSPPDGGHFAYVLRSTDKGESWELTPIGEDPSGRLDFNENELLELPDGRILAMMRSYEVPGRFNAFMQQCFSEDGGRTWSPPEPTPIWGYPPHLTLLDSGAIHCVYAHRRYPYGVRACLSHDNGATWDIENEIIVRDDAVTGRVGYPSSVQLGDGTLVTVYTIERIPRVPYSPEDRVSWGGVPTGDIMIRGWRRDPDTQASVGGCHTFAGLSRYTEDYVRARGQKTSQVLYEHSPADPTD